MEIRNLSDFIPPQPTPEEQAVLDLLYESPITLVADQMRTEMEANCVKVVQSYGFDVNAEELAKALAYDRGQYDKGYAAARQKYERPHGEWITIHKQNSFGQDCICFECDKCHKYKMPIYKLMITEQLDVCPNCGADMRPEEAET